MDNVIEYLRSCVSVFPRISAGNIFEILIIAVMIYAILVWFKNTKAWTLLRGILIIFVFIIFCVIFQLDTILWIFGKIAAVAAIAIIVIFQPELRKALEQLGSGNFLTKIMSSQEQHQKGFSEKIANEIVKAAFELSKTKTGALIVIEVGDSLKDIERTGISIDGLVSSQLLVNIFEHNTPLHDGAVVIRGNLITAATCYLPLSDNMKISKIYGTRHRAALGISEITDSITVVVSEETGNVSVAEAGVLSVMPGADKLREELNKFVDSGEKEKGFLIKRRNKSSK